MDYFEFVDVPGSDLKAPVPKLPVEEVVHAAILAMQSYLGAIEFDSRMMGWGGESVARKRAEFLQQMLAVARTP